MRFSEFSRTYPYYCELYDADGEEYTVGVTAKYTPETHEYVEDEKFEDVHVYNIETGVEITHTLTSQEMVGIHDGIRAENDPRHGPGCEFD